MRPGPFTRGLAALLATIAAAPVHAAAESASSEASAEDQSVEAEAYSEAPDDKPEPASRFTAASYSPQLLSASTSTGAKSAATSQALPLPKAEGSITGMGESFSPDLSSGAATYSIPMQVAPGRNGVQPELGLMYRSTTGNGPIGLGWSIGVPFISRQADRGMPRYRDAATWTLQEDRFFYNGGQELVPVDAAEIAAAECGSASCEPVPAELAGWQQYRARVEGSFMRFFRAPDGRRWVVQGKDGSRLDFGQLPVGRGPAEAVARSQAALQTELGNGQGRIYRWLVTRSADAHGSTIYYLHDEDGGQRYLSDLFYTSPHGACGGLPDAAARTSCAAPLSDYGNRVHLVYESRPDVTSSYASGWEIRTARRLRRVEMTSAEGAPGRRTLVRRYHLTYDPESYWSLLSTVQVEGRPHHVDPLTLARVGDRDVDETSLGDAIVGTTLAPIRLHYSTQPQSATFAPGLGGVDGRVHRAPVSPPYSVGANADLFDVNSDGLADLVVTDPARFHTPSGGPAVGVYFNGFDGPSTQPAGAGSFSGAVATAVRADLSQVFRLANSNISPMDVDGDGRADYLHLPRQRDTGYFTPVRGGAADATTPAQQQWSWAYLPRQLPSWDADPRIDFAHDASRIRAFDVNGDHLVDLVRTTGTSIQVWLNLGWLPGGDGRYGSYTFDPGSHQFQLSTAPIETCLPTAGTPLDFGDPETFFADMNGDGITDIVRARAGRVIYWPGRGEGAFGTGTATCAPGLVAGRYVEMAQPPTEVNANLDGVHLADLNADGLDDLVQVRFSDVDVWFNYGGQRFSGRVRMAGTPAAPAFDTRTRFADVDGSGTVDILYARADDWEWLDPMGGQRPRLLTAVENGQGARTDLQYESSVEDYLGDLAEADACSGPACERFLWSAEQSGCDAKVKAATATCVRRSGGSPVISTVVRQVDTTNQLDLLGVPATRLTTRFRYHDGYYEGIEQEFRGFGAADSIAVGVDAATTLEQRSYMHQGRRSGKDASNRLADNPAEALKGASYQTEVRDGAGTYLSSTHTSFAIRQQVLGLSKVAVSYAVPSQTDTFMYDTSPFVATPAQVTSLPSVTFADGTSAPAASVHVRGSGYAQTRSTIDSVDGLGQVLQSTAHGRVRGEQGETPDERIVQHDTYVNVAGSATGWLWAPQTHYLTGSGDPTHLGDSTISYSPAGDGIRVTTPATQTVVPTFDGDAEAEGFGARSPEALLSTVQPDPWGASLVTCVGGDTATLSTCLRLGAITYDSDYAETAIAQYTVTRPLAGGAFAWLETRGVWDRGTRQLVEMTDENGETSTMSQDGLGRVTLVRKPDTQGCSGKFPSARIEYVDTTDPAHTPLSSIHTTTFLSCTDASRKLESYAYVDGNGATRAGLTSGPDEPAHAWVKAGISVLDRRGNLMAAYGPDFFAGAADDYRAVLAAPALTPARAVYDAFGRRVLAVETDGTPTRFVYHALGTEVWDALDLSQDTVHRATPTISRTDGHGRVIDDIVQGRQPGSSAVQIVRLFTLYRADGVVTRAERVETSDLEPRGQTSIVGGHVVARDFFYDSTGRRVAATDPNTDNRTNGATWRYLFNRANDLVAMRDPRGCGQNFYYDLAGRGLAQSYVGCGEAQLQESTVATLPAGAVGWTTTTSARAVDSLTIYDGYDGAWTTNPGAMKDFPASPGGLVGRIAATIDRGQRSAYAYDRRGEVIWEARQLALIPTQGSVALQLANPGVPGAGDALDGQPVVFDALHTYVRTHVIDHAGRPSAVVLPADPDFPPGQSAPRMAGLLGYDRRGLGNRTSLQIVAGGGIPSAVDGTLSIGGATIETRPIVTDTTYTRDALVARIVYGDDKAGTRTPTQTSFDYDVRRRPLHMLTQRVPTASNASGDRPLGAVSVVHAQGFRWDAVSNLTGIDDERLGSEWPAGHRPQSSSLVSDGFYRVVGVDYAYTQDGGATADTDAASDWRGEQARVRSADPMRQKPAPMLAALPEDRVASLTWSYDWLANLDQTTDDAHAFFERSTGNATNGVELSATERPSALYLSSDLTGPPAARGGWLELDYGVGGNVVDMTVHGRCVDAPSKTCADPGGALASRRSFLRSSCSCQSEQAYQYRWDEVNRLAEARRYDRSGGTGNYVLKVRQRYRYDATNERTVKHTLDLDAGGEPPQRFTIYPFPGALERRGLVRATDQYKADPTLDTETEYVVSGARIVWQAGNPSAGVDADHRISVSIGDLLGSTSAVMDLRSGELTQYGTYYPNGSRETLRGTTELVPFEPLGFTGKEDDEEVGLVYFGERYLVPGIARWLSPDPLEIHSMGAGEVMNAYHYISGHLLQGRDALGLSETTTTTTSISEDGGLAPVADGLPHAGEKVNSFVTHDFSDGQQFTEVKLESGARMYYANGKLTNWVVYFSSLDVARMMDVDNHRHAGWVSLNNDLFTLGVLMHKYWQGAGILVPWVGRAQMLAAAADCEGMECIDVLGGIQTDMSMTIMNGGPTPRSPRAGEPEPAPTCTGGCFVADTSVATSTGPIAIDDLRVGDRVLTPHGEASTSEPDASWHVAHLQMDGGEGVIDVTLLRSATWFECENVAPGRKVWLDMPEMGAVGWADVTAVDASASVDDGAGNVVIGTYERTSSDLYALDLGDEGILEVTGAHRLYSADRNDWVAVADLEPGELLRTRSGDARVVALEPEHRSARVFNLEVDGEHAYLVGGADVWAHNNCGCSGGSNPSKVYRYISAEERVALEAGEPLRPKGEGGTIAEHVQGKDTGHISAGHKPEHIERFDSGNGLVEIDVKTAVEDGAKYVNHDNVVQAAKRSGDSKTVRDATRAHEVLFGGEVSNRSVKLVPGGKGGGKGRGR